MTANRAVLDAASRYRETFLFNIYRMGKNSIERGSRDTWTVSPHRMAAAGGGGHGGAARSRQAPRSAAARSARLHPAVRSTRLSDGDEVRQRAAVERHHGDARHGAVHGAPAIRPARSSSRPAQAFRPHVLDMFEPQDHPDDIPYPGRAADAAVRQRRVDARVPDGREVRSHPRRIRRPVRDDHGVARPPAGRVGRDGRRDRGRIPDRASAERRVHRRQPAAEGRRGRVLAATDDGPRRPPAIYIAAKPATLPILQKAAADLGLTFTAVSSPPAGDALKLRAVRIGLWDRYGGSVESGWVRWLLERYEFPFDVVYPQTLDAGNLNAKYDVLIFPTDAIPERDGRERSRPRICPRSIATGSAASPWRARFRS